MWKLILTGAMFIAPQSAIEHYAWEDPYPLVPMSRTAIAITGPVRVLKSSISFNGKAVPASIEGRAWRVWDESGKKNSATIYRLAKDPGTLRQGNTLCGPDKATYVVLWQSYDDFTGGAIKMAVYTGAKAPFDANSPGLCGTYNYVWRAK